MIDTRALINRHLYELCNKIGSRPIGTINNHKAEVYISGVFKKQGLHVEKQPYDCLEWRYEKVKLLCDGEDFEAIANTYSESCCIDSALLAACNTVELENGDFKDKVALIYGELTQSPLASKNNKFYNPEKHQKIVKLLEEKEPSAIIAVSHRTNNPVPILEDWDFKIPSVTISTIDGMKLLKRKGGEINLQIESSFSKSYASNIIASDIKYNKNKIIICAHVDTKYGTDGAADNTAGIVALLTVAELLRSENLPIDIEFTAFNGEEYYGIGEELYIEKNINDFEKMLAVINIDGIGHYSSTSNISFYECSEQFVREALDLKGKYPGIIQVDPWPASDHTLFWSRKIPSIAISSTGTFDLFHTMNDNIDSICIDKVEESVEIILELVRLLAKNHLENKKISNR